MASAQVFRQHQFRLMTAAQNGLLLFQRNLREQEKLQMRLAVLGYETNRLKADNADCLSQSALRPEPMQPGKVRWLKKGSTK